MSRTLSNVIYGVLGASNLWPWNVLITASTLARDKLADTPRLYANYSSAVMTTSTFTALLVNTYLASRPQNYAQRVVVGELITAISFLALATIGGFVSGGDWLATVVTVVFLSSLGTALVQNGTLAITQRIPGGSQALSVMNGQAVSGVLPPLMSMAVTGAFQEAISPLTFLSVTVLCVIATVLFKSSANENYVHLAEEETESDAPSRNDLWELLKHLEVPNVTILLGFTVSLSYPVFANVVGSRNIDQRYFSPLTHLVWNTGDLLGRVLCSEARFQLHRGRALITYSLARFLIIAVLIVLARLRNPSDILYLLVMLIYGVSGGYLISSAIAYAPTCAPPHLQPAAGGLLGLVMTVGLLVGSAFSFLLVLML